jgi:hypothetical protein
MEISTTVKLSLGRMYGIAVQKSVKHCFKIKIMKVFIKARNKRAGMENKQLKSFKGN